jgi:TnpA family transposase
LDYHIQGWKCNKIYPDFIAAENAPENMDEYGTIYVLETKGVHLKNEDTKEAFGNKSYKFISKRLLNTNKMFLPCAMNWEQRNPGKNFMKNFPVTVLNFK